MSSLCLLSALLLLRSHPFPVSSDLLFPILLYLIVPPSSFFFSSFPFAFCLIYSLSYQTPAPFSFSVPLYPIQSIHSKSIISLSHIPLVSLPSFSVIPSTIILQYFTLLHLLLPLFLLSNATTTSWSVWHSILYQVNQMLSSPGSTFLEAERRSPRVKPK